LEGVTQNNVPVLELIFGHTGQWIITGLVILLLGGKPITRFFRGFKKVKAGLGGIEVEPNLLSDEKSCPHVACNEEQSRNTQKIYDEINALKEKDNENATILSDINSNLISMKLSLETALKKTDELYIDQLKLVFYNKEMPEAERLIGGLRYIADGHNHQFKRDTVAFCQNNLAMYEAAVAVAPKLRVKEIDELMAREG
jgi:uncharacterized protein (UPF0216 family)